MPRLLVVSPVHPPDDPRIRHKLIKTLSRDWDVTFAGVGRGPVDKSGLHWVELNGGRLRRSLRAAVMVLRGRYDVASLHDPEMLPSAIVASLLGRRIVFDVHENVPGQIRTKSWIPAPLRRPLARLASRMLRVAERRLAITLAESGYGELFARRHPVFPNYLEGEPPSPQEPDPDVGVVYLGDITAQRGLEVAVAASGAAGVSTVTLMGRCSPQFRTELNQLAAASGLTLNFRGFVTPDQALKIAGRGLIGLSPLLDTPNYRQSLPTKVLEYLAVGLPTLASDLPGTREVVGSKPGVVLVPAGDVGAWQAAIAAAVDNVALRTAAHGGSAEIRRSYVWPADDVRAFYAELLDG